jgi:hypothetical protein
MRRVTGVDAFRIDGVSVMTIQTVVAKLGTELQKSWPTEQHFTSWLGLTPKRDVSGGKVIRHTRDKGSNRVAGILRLALFRRAFQCRCIAGHLQTISYGNVIMQVSTSTTVL